MPPYSPSPSSSSPSPSSPSAPLSLSSLSPVGVHREWDRLAEVVVGRPLDFTFPSALPTGDRALGFLPAAFVGRAAALAGKRWSEADPDGFAHCAAQFDARRRRRRGLTDAADDETRDARATAGGEACRGPGAQLTPTPTHTSAPNVPLTSDASVVGSTRAARA